MQRYAHLADEELRKAAATIANLVNVRSAEEAVQKNEEEDGKTGHDKIEPA